MPDSLPRAALPPHLQSMTLCPPPVLRVSLVRHQPCKHPAADHVRTYRGAHLTPSSRVLPSLSLLLQHDGVPTLPSFPRYVRSLLQSRRVHLSPASWSLLSYAVEFYFRGEKTKSLHFLHMLYTKLMYVRMRDEERRRAVASGAGEATAAPGSNETTPASHPAGTPIPTAQSSSSRITTSSPVVSSSRSVQPLVSDGPHQPPREAEELESRLHSMHIDAPLLRVGSHSRTRSNSFSAGGGGGGGESPSPPSEAGSTDSHGSQARHRPNISSLAASGAASLEYPFTRFFDMYATFTEAAMRGYCSVFWDRQDHFLRANLPRTAPLNRTTSTSGTAATTATGTADPNTPSISRSVSTPASVGLSRSDSMMSHQAALFSSLQVEARDSIADHQADELAILDILRNDVNLQHFPIDWPTLLMLTHESYRRHMAEMARAVSTPAASSTPAAAASVLDREHHDGPGSSRPLHSVVAPNSPWVSPSPVSSSPQSMGDAADAVLHALRQWRRQKARTRREERARMTAAERARLETEDICYVPIACPPPESPVAQPATPQNQQQQLRRPTSSKDLWSVLRSDLRRRRLLKLLRTQREFYLALAKHKVLTYRPAHAQHEQPANTTRDTSCLPAPSTGEGGGGSGRVFSSTMSLPQSVSMPNIARLGALLGESGIVDTPFETPLSPTAPSSSSPTATTTTKAPAPKYRDLTPNIRVSTTHTSSSRRAPRIIFLAGGMSAGKSTVLAHLRATGHLFGVRDDAVLVESDKFKLVDPVYQSLPPTDAQRARFVHPQSLITAEETLLAAVRARRDVIVDGTMSWRPYIEQTVRMVRESHVTRFKRGRGEYDPATGALLEEYWVEDSLRSPVASPSSPSAACTSPGSHDFDAPLPYVVCMLGVTVHWSVAVSRAIRRAVSIGRSVPLDSLLGSYSKYAVNFDAYTRLVDAYSLLDNSDDDMHVLGPAGANVGPTRILSRGLGEATEHIVSPDLYKRFRQQRYWPTDPTGAEQMEHAIATMSKREEHEEEQLVPASDSAIADTAPTTFTPPAADVPSTSSSLAIASPPPATRSSSSAPAVTSYDHLLPGAFRWLLAQVGGDDDILTEDELEEDEDGTDTDDAETDTEEQHEEATTTNETTEKPAIMTE